MEHEVTAGIGRAAADRRSAAGPVSASQSAADCTCRPGCAIGRVCCGGGRGRERRRRTWQGTLGGQMMRRMNEGPQTRRVVNRRSINTKPSQRDLAGTELWVQSGCSAFPANRDRSPRSSSMGNAFLSARPAHYVKYRARSRERHSQLPPPVPASLPRPGQCGEDVTRAPTLASRGPPSSSSVCTMVMRH